jgi:ubiquinol-cytochrome c reductase cytochrome b subunit
MIILVTADNYLLMFVGWEGINLCLKWYKYIIILTKSNYNFFQRFSTLVNFKLRSDLRIGPHNEDVLSVIIGSVLGDSHLERRKNGLGTRIIFEQCSRNVEYIMWFQKFFSNRGYCTGNISKLKTRIKRNNKVFYQYRISSYTFTSFNWLHDMFYKFVDNKFIKIVPSNLEIYLTPLALAIWFMDNGSIIYNTARIATNNFNYNECIFICKVLKNKYDIDATVQSSGRNKGYIVYITKNSFKNFVNHIKPFVIPSMYYKLEI